MIFKLCIKVALIGKTLAVGNEKAVPVMSLFFWGMD